MGKGNFPVPPRAAGTLMGGLGEYFPFLLECLALLSVVLRNVRSPHCGERLQPQGLYWGEREAFTGPLPPQMLSQGFSRPFCHTHANLLSCGVSFLLLSTLSLCLSFSETLLYCGAKPWLPLMLFPFPVNPLLVVNPRALETLILQLFCQDNFPLPLLGANPLSSQIQSRRQGFKPCLSAIPTFQLLWSHLPFGFVFLLLFCTQSHYCYFSVCLQNTRINLNGKIPLYQHDGQPGFYCKINIPGKATRDRKTREGFIRFQTELEDDLSSVPVSGSLPSLTPTISLPTDPCLGQTLPVVIVAPLKYLFGVSQHP